LIVGRRYQQMALAANPDSIDATVAVGWSDRGRPDRSPRDGARTQHNTRSCDTTDRITDIRAVDDCAGRLAADRHACNSEHRGEREAGECELCERPKSQHEPLLI